MRQKTAIIIGAGPAGLTTAYELLHQTRVRPIVYEMSGDIGGISKTVDYRGNRIDIGGHRFFSKSARIMQWWQNVLPLQGAPARDDLALGRDVPLSAEQGAPDPERDDRVMLVRSRLSRILFLHNFFDYPISLNMTTLSNLGFKRLVKMALGYLAARVSPIKQERSLEDFLINRFGKELYRTFFRDYTEKVWGVPCNRIRPEWGAQRIKGLSITKAVLHAMKRLVSKDGSLNQNSTETSLIGQFMYPKLGPGQLWEEVANTVREKGGEIHLRHRVDGFRHDRGTITGVRTTDTATGEVTYREADHFFSTMPVRELVQSFNGGVPADVRRIAQGLVYRDFITVGLLLTNLKIRNATHVTTINGIVPDNWIYIQEPEVRLGRLQIFNNWSPYMVRDPDTVWIGLEYFCSEGDDLWRKSDAEFAVFATDELAQIDIIDKRDVRDSVVIRVPKAYPAYFGTYDQFDVLRQFTDQFENLFLIGRNGMHRYNNQDHSMLTGMTAVENVRDGVRTKENVWSVNIDDNYHESN